MTILLAILGVLVALGVVALGAGYVFSRRVMRTVQSAMPPAGQACTVSNGKIHYVERGEGRPVVLIHGLSGNLHNFTYAMIEPLAKTHRVIAIDRPGCGHSLRASDDCARLPNQAGIVAEFLNEIGLDRPLIVGHSLGGAVALALALNHPDKVGGLALISPLTAVQTHVPEVFNGINVPSPAMRRLLAETFAIPGTIRNGPNVVSAIFAPDAVPADFRDRGGGLLALRPEAFYAASTDMHAVPMDIESLAARYAEIRVPAGVLYGDRDGVLDPETHIAALRGAIPNLDIEIIEGAGHMPPVVHVERSLAFVQRLADRI